MAYPYRKKFEHLRPYLVETGAVAYRAFVVFLLLAGVGEFLRPGFLGTVVSPSLLVLLAIFAGVLALFDDESERKISGWFVLASLLVVVGGAWASWYVWADVPGSRNALTFATGFVLATTFYFCARRPAA